MFVITQGFGGATLVSQGYIGGDAPVAVGIRDILTLLDLRDVLQVTDTRDALRATDTRDILQVVP